LLRDKTGEKGLGIIVRNNISWESYIYSIAAKASNVLQFRKRTYSLMTYNNARRKLYASGRVSALLLYGDLVATPNNLKYQK